MRSEKHSLQTQIVSILLVTNLCLTYVLGSLPLINNGKRIAKRLDMSGPTLQYDTQIGNLLGRPGEGYYLQVEIGTPPQKVLNTIKYCFD